MSDEKFDIEAMMYEARERQKLLTENMPEGVDRLTHGFRSKIPYKIMCIREAQFCRAEEFSRAACDMFERDDVVVGVSNTRSTLECLAVIFHINEKMVSQQKNGLDSDLDEQVMKVLLGFKSDPDFPQMVNVLTMVDKLDSKTPGIRKNYNTLSEVAHPNYSGAVGVYGAPDYDCGITWFNKKKDSERVRKIKGLGLVSLIPVLKLFEHEYNRTADLIEPFGRLCDANLPKPSS